MSFSLQSLLKFLCIGARNYRQVNAIIDKCCPQQRAMTEHQWHKHTHTGAGVTPVPSRVAWAAAQLARQPRFYLTKRAIRPRELQTAPHVFVQVARAVCGFISCRSVAEFWRSGRKHLGRMLSKSQPVCSLLLISTIVFTACKWSWAFSFLWQHLCCRGVTH